MTHDVTQWLAEIKTLKQQLAEAQRERDDAYTSAANWRKLYETEAQQRRTEADLAQQKVQALQTQLQQLQDLPGIQAEGSGVIAAQEMIDQLQAPAELKAKLVDVILERDRLAQALQAEQTNHDQTRKSLTTALGDTIDMLAKERAAKQANANSPTPSAGGSDHPLKTPSLELPNLDQVQFPS